MAVKTPQKQGYSQMFLLDRARKRPAQFASLHPQVVSSVTALRDSLSYATRDSLWISYASDLTEALVKNISWPPSSLGLGLFVHSLDMKTILTLTACFRRFAFTTGGGFLPAEELAEVLEAENRPDLFIGGSVDNATETITFWRGNVKPLTVPFSAFETSGDGTAPDFNNFSVIDSGQTVQLGDYEAAVDSILYEYNSEYRRRISRKRLQEDQSFGASLRRLRKQRGLRRQDFEPHVSAKTIARIETGKVKRIQKKTRNALAERLSVEPEKIATF